MLDLDYYTKISQKPANFKKPAIYLAGSFGPDSPMDKGARWFIETVFPIIKKKIPGIHFYIIGNRADTTLADITDKSISIVGKVDSVLPYLQNSDVVLVPLMFESGTRFKILEAGACNIPIVSTTLGAEGLDVVDGRDILIADKPQEFADSILRLILDKRYAKQIAFNCKKLVQEQYGIKRLEKEGEVILNSFFRLKKGFGENVCNL